MAVSCDIFVSEDSIGNAPIESAVVSVYDPTTLSLVAQGISGADGRASFLLPGGPGLGTIYEVRAFKLGVIFQNPFIIGVVEPVVSTNKFDIEGTALTLPVSPDQRVCRCTGRMSGFDNKPVPNASVRISAFAESGTQTPKVLDGSLISPDTIVVHSDEDGIVTVDLLRNGKYYVTFSGEEDVVWPITVPDRASVNLIDLIHPAPVRLNWDQNDAPGNAITISIGEVYTVNYTVTLTDYREVGAANNLQKVVDVWNVTPDTIDLSAGDAVIVITGRAVGTGEVTVSNSPDLMPIQLPTPVLLFDTLQVTVIP